MLYNKSMKKALILLLLISLTGCSNVNIGGNKTLKEWEKPGKEHLKLKVSKNKILDVNEKDDIRCKKEDPANCSNFGKMKEYKYVSDVVAQEKHKIIDGIDVKEDISKRTGNAIFFKNPKKLGAVSMTTSEEWTGIFYIGDTFYNTNGTWNEIDYATTTTDAYNQQTATTTADIIRSIFTKNVFATNYSVGNGDGGVSNTATGNTTWAAAHDRTVGDNPDQSNLIFNACSAKAGATSWFACRGYMPVDTSAIGAGNVVSSSSLNIYVEGNGGNADNDAQSYVSVVKTYTASFTALEKADIEDCGSDNDTAARAKYTPITTGSDKYMLGTLPNGGWINIPLNATGMGWVNVTGYSPLGIREGHDLENSAPDSIWNYLYSRTSHYTGTASDPYLTVIYSVPTTPSSSLDQTILFE